MKKTLTVLAVLTLGSIIAFSSVQDTPIRENIEVMQEDTKPTIAPETSPEPILETLESKVADDVVIEKEPVTEPVSASLPTNEQLILQFEWDKLSSASAIIASYELKYPSYFTSENKMRSFEYIRNVARAAAGGDMFPSSELYTFNILVKTSTFELIGENYGVKY